MVVGVSLATLGERQYLSKVDSWGELTRCIT